MNKILLLGFVLILLSSLVNAESIGTFEVEEDIELYQTCNSCSYCNFTSIKYPNSTTILRNQVTTKDASYFYLNLGGGNITSLGEYSYCYDCGDSSNSETGCLTFDITNNGKPINRDSGIGITISIVLIGITFLLGFFTINSNGIMGQIGCGLGTVMMIVFDLFMVAKITQNSNVLDPSISNHLYTIYNLVLKFQWVLIWGVLIFILVMTANYFSTLADNKAKKREEEYLFK